MKKHPTLEAAEEVLNNCFCYYKDDNVLAVSNDKAEMPFLHLIIDQNYPETLLLSFASDFPLASMACQLLLALEDIADVALFEDFYIAKDGNTYFGEDASKMYMWDSQCPLEEVDPESSTIH